VSLFGTADRLVAGWRAGDDPDPTFLALAASHQRRAEQLNTRTHSEIPSREIADGPVGPNGSVLAGGGEDLAVAPVQWVEVDVFHW
jgi:hypothetical protein